MEDYDFIIYHCKIVMKRSVDPVIIKRCEDMITEAKAEMIDTIKVMRDYEIRKKIRNKIFLPTPEIIEAKKKYKIFKAKKDKLPAEIQKEVTFIEGKLIMLKIDHRQTESEEDRNKIIKKIIGYTEQLNDIIGV